MSVCAPAPSLWLHSRTYDLGWYALLPFVLTIGLTLAANALGENGPFQVYMLVSILSGLPHNMITWLLIMPATSRRYYEPGVLFGPFVVTALVLLPAVLLAQTPGFAWALSLVTVIAYYHVTRQHMGMLHSCDLRYVQVTGDASIRQDSRDLRWLLGSLSASLLIWKLTGPPLKMGYAVQPMDFTFYPAPVIVPVITSIVALFFALRVLRTFWRRHNAGRAFATAHAVIAIPAMISLTLAAMVPNHQFYLTLALVSAYHNLQYFGFCYTHHHLRAVADPQAQDPFTNWARDRRWARWFALPVALGFLFVALLTRLPAHLQIVVTMWFMTSHYFVDGNIWRRKFYPLMGRFASGRVAEPEPTGVPVAVTN